MTIYLSEQANEELYQEMLAHAQFPDPEDELDVLLQKPEWLAKGYEREITLREGKITVV